MITLSSAGGPPSESGKSGFRSSVTLSPGRHATNRNGPLPTGARLNSARIISEGGTLSSRCRGTGGHQNPSSGRACGRRNRNRIVNESITSADSTSPR